MEKLEVAKVHAPLSLVASLRGNISWTLLGNVVYAGSQWGMLVAFAKFGDAQMVGEFGLGLAITGPVFMFANLQLASVLATDVNGGSAFSDYFGARVITTAAALLTSCVVALATYGTGGASGVIVAVAVTKALESLSDVFQGLFQRQERMDRVAKSMMLRGVFSLSVVVLAVHAGGGVVVASMAMACVSTLVLISFDLPNGKGLLGGLRPVGPRFSERHLIAMIRTGLPLGIVTMLISLTINMPRYFLERHGGSREVGLFVGLAYILSASTMVVGAIGRAALPRLAKFYAAGQMLRFQNLVRALVLCGFAIGGIGLLIAVSVGRPVLRLLYTAEYAPYAPVLAVLMLAAGIGHAASLLGYAVTAARHFLAQIPLWIAVAAAALVGSAVLIPRLGVTGAAWALVVSAAVQFASYSLLYARQVLRLRHRGAP